MSPAYSPRSPRSALPGLDAPDLPGAMPGGSRRKRAESASAGTVPSFYGTVFAGLREKFIDKMYL